MAPGWSCGLDRGDGSGRGCGVRRVRVYAPEPGRSYHSAYLASVPGYYVDTTVAGSSSALAAAGHSAYVVDLPGQGQTQPASARPRCTSCPAAVTFWNLTAPARPTATWSASWRLADRIPRRSGPKATSRMTIHQRASRLSDAVQTASRPMPAVPGVEHRQVETGRLRIHLAEAGTGPPLLLMHGWPQHWYAWRELIPLLAGSRRLICPDLRASAGAMPRIGAYRRVLPRLSPAPVAII
jgi:hypothetical protein